MASSTSSTPRIYEVLVAAWGAGWDVHVILTPGARRFVDIKRLKRVSGALPSGASFSVLAWLPTPLWLFLSL